MFPRTRTATYDYDHGDDWRHTIRLVETIRDRDVDQVECVAGEGDAPPEDVGSIPGFDRFLRIIGDTSDLEHDDMAAWGHARFYEPFSLDAVNRRIREWGTDRLLDEWDRRHQR